MRRATRNRRSEPRFEVLGDLHGTAEAVVELPLRNVSAGGCLVESPVTLVPGSVHVVTVRSHSWESPVQVRVRHVRPAGTRTARTYFIGLEFLSMTPAMAGEIQLWLVAGGRATEV